MNLTLSLKTLFRTAAKTLVTFALLAAVTFMLAYNLLDFTLTKREFDSAVEGYDGVFSVEYGMPDYMDSSLKYYPRIKGFPDEYVSLFFYFQIAAIMPTQIVFCPIIHFINKDFHSQKYPEFNHFHMLPQQIYAI
jgi:hypothetical protein